MGVYYDNGPIYADAFYFADGAGLVGHDAADVNRWLGAHPDFDGSIYVNLGDGGDDMEVTDIFFPEAEEASEIERAA